ncbi:WecB/TagA/CpsF family glycosyltransferase [Methylococcaceae bacterium WWC4]|nr:WecB/TagA/CpsF family glycosyltransferase [Methylococcaceae bacterium WWC4]
MATEIDRLMGMPVYAGPHADVLAEMARAISAGEVGRYISITNTESMYHALRRPDHLKFIQNANFSLCDGVGVIAAGYFWGLKINRYNGPILQLDCSEYGQSKGWRHFYYGGKEGVAELMAEKLKEQFPQMQVVGTYCPPFRELTEEEDEEVVRMINDAKPDIVWVGLGLVKQEAWIAKHLHRVRAPWMVGVGAAFDYHSGAVPWAPAWIRSLGLEWVFRLIIQPKLRAKRYWWSFIFVLEAALAGLMRRFQRANVNS